MDVTLEDPLVGREVDRRYAVESRVAEGGMATVYLALDRRLDRRVALKVMHSDLAQDAEFVARFVQEARSAARLSHPNAVQVFDQGADGEVLYLAMEYLPGRTLRDALAERGTLSPREALAVLEPVLDALSAAHAVGIVHRDVKPENVLLTDDGRIKVADFGLARAAAAPSVPGTDTGSGPLIGTVAYLAPELVSLGITDPRTDVYAVGIMLFEMLTGRQPFTAEDPVDVALQHVHSDVPAPSSFAPELPEALDHVVLAATSRDPGGRPEDAADLLRLVRQVHASLPAEVLDLRADAPFPLTPYQPANDATEVLAHPGAAQPTRSLVLPRERKVAERRDDGPLVTIRSLPRRPLIAGVVAVALVLVIGIWWIFAGPGAYTTTPRVYNLTQAAAQQSLTTAGLRSNIEHAFDLKVPAGQVVSTDPSAGEEVRKDGTVTLVISKGPELVAVPEVVGQSETAATSVLTGAGLVVEGRSTTFSDKPAGTLLKVTPAAGVKVQTGSKVAIVVSKGVQPIDIPGNLVGQTADAAEVALKAVGFTVKRTEDPNGTTPGLVTATNPASGQAPKGSVVEILVAPGDPLVAVPSVNGQTVDAASALLKSLGLNVEVHGDGTFTGRHVFSQQPNGGDTVPRGTTVVLTSP